MSYQQVDKGQDAYASIVGEQEYRLETQFGAEWPPDYRIK